MQQGLLRVFRFSAVCVLHERRPHPVGKTRHDRLVQTARYSNAMRYVLTGEEFDAVDAHRMGVVQEVVEPGQQLDRAQELAEVIAAQAPQAVRAALAHAQSALLDGWRSTISSLR
jgi:enoyl-CoA hydratase/carnithine racemase